MKQYVFALLMVLVLGACGDDPKPSTSTPSNANTPSDPNQVNPQGELSWGDIAAKCGPKVKQNSSLEQSLVDAYCSCAVGIIQTKVAIAEFVKHSADYLEEYANDGSIADKCDNEKKNVRTSQLYPFIY